MYGSYVDIGNFHMRDTAGLKTCSGKEFLGWIAAWMTKTHREQSLSKHYTIHILILIPVITQSDSYFLVMIPPLSMVGSVITPPTDQTII